MFFSLFFPKSLLKRRTPGRSFQLNWSVSGLDFMGHDPHPASPQILQGLHLNPSSLGRVFPKIPVAELFAASWVSTLLHGAFHHFHPLPVGRPRVQVKAKKLLLTLSRPGRRNPSRDAAHTTFSSSSCSLFCNTSRCGCECCWNSSWCTLPRVGTRVLPKIGRNCVNCAQFTALN